MLEFPPNYEICDFDLSAQSFEARFGSYKCTYCAAYVNNLLKGGLPKFWRQAGSAFNPSHKGPSGKAQS